MGRFYIAGIRETVGLQALWASRDLKIHRSAVSQRQAFAAALVSSPTKLASCTGFQRARNQDEYARAAETKTAEEACAAAAAVLANYAKDIPFALLYLIDHDGQVARLAGAASPNPGDEAAPLAVDLDVTKLADAWPLAEVVRSQKIAVVENLAIRLACVPRGQWPDPPRLAAVVPIRSNKAHQLAGLLVAGVSPRLRFDDLYRSFLDLVAGQIATSIANARAYEEERRRAEALAEIDRAKTTFFS